MADKVISHKDLLSKRHASEVPESPLNSLEGRLRCAGGRRLVIDLDRLMDLCHETARKEALLAISKRYS